MPTKQKDAAQPSISPVLFLTVEGEPMSFFLRPGPVKRDLQPLIVSGGGAMCRVQQPGAILLVDPEERSSIPESAVHWYVSTQYIYDCIEKDEQLDLEAYRLTPEVVQKQSARQNTGNSSALTGGRTPYTAEEDAAILKYVSQHGSQIGGNRLWQEMEKQRVTTHSWQSMKYRYRARLTKQQTEAPEVETTEDGNQTDEQVEQNQESDVQKPSTEEKDEAAPPQTHPAESDLSEIQEQQDDSTQLLSFEDQSEPAGGAPENKEAEKGEEKPQTEEQSAERAEEETMETETCGRTEEPPVDPQTENQIAAAETTETDRDELPPLSEPEAPPPAPPESPPTSPSEKSTETLKFSPTLESPQRRVTRRKLNLKASASPEPYSKKLRSSSTVAEQSALPLQTVKKKESAKSTLQMDEITEASPPKKARGRSPTPETEAVQDSSGEAPVPPTSSADESHPAPQKAEKKKKKKRPLGILEQATREFESDSDSGAEETSDSQNRAEEAVAATDAGPSTSDAAAAPAARQSEPEPEPEPEPDPESEPEAEAEEEEEEGGGGEAISKGTADPGPSLQDSRQCPPTSDRIPAAESIGSKAAAAEPAACEPFVSDPISTTSKAHLFIFESESQEDGSQCEDAPPDPPPTADALPLSLTQVQLEEDVQMLRELMNQTSQNLGDVTKALLKTSGDFSAALNLLQNPSSVSGPFWSRLDDTNLLLSDSTVRQKLQEKYGEEEVAKRIVFLEVLG